MLRQKASHLFQLEAKYGANNYKPLPVMLSKGKGIYVYDTDGKEYFDFLSGIGSVNQGHCHPKIIAAVKDQIEKLTLTSRAFHNDQLGPYEKKLSEIFGYEKVLPTNTGTEAVETAIKISRKWAYEKKKVPNNKALIIGATNNFHGRTIGSISLSTDPLATTHFGPLHPNVNAVCPVTNSPVRYGNIGDLEKCFREHQKTAAAFIVEPIQGEGGIIVPPKGYLQKANELCTKYNILFIADEIQTGIGRTGKMLCIDHDNIKADMVLLGKSLNGGVVPVSAVLGDDEVMSVITPGTHGSTFGGNPLGCRVSMAALDVVINENLSENALQMGEFFRSLLKKIKSDKIVDIRGQGLLNAIELQPDIDAWNFCIKLKKLGLITRPTKSSIIRFAPPLLIKEDEIKSAVQIIDEALQ
eukprot:NODE_491_length_6850_cov_0.331210.p2 type:complete len:412 gc:universal NODE_491_length_6850_cov_0.331210:1985-750(-)